MLGRSSPVTDLIIGLGFSAALAVLLGKWKAARDVVAVSIAHPLTKSVINVGEDGGGDVQEQDDSGATPSNASGTSPNGVQGGVADGAAIHPSSGEQKAKSSTAGGYRQEEEEQPFIMARRRSG
jgi:hypothetical protein